VGGGLLCSDVCENFGSDVNIRETDFFYKIFHENVFVEPIVWRTCSQVQYFKYREISVELGTSCFYQSTPKGQIFNLQE
jgi:hypothetical protein